MLTMRWFFLLLALIFGAAQSQEPAPSTSKGGENQKTKPANSEQRPTTDQRGTKHSPLIIEVLPAPDAEKKTKQEREHEEEKAKNERILTYSTLALVVVTFFLAIFTWRLWRATGKLVKGAEDTAKKQLRAYLGVRNGKISVIGPGHLQAIIEVHNTGSTPAHHVTKAIDVDIRDSQNPGDFLMPKPHKGKWPIVPGAYWTFRGDITKVTDEIQGEITKYKKSIFVWGRVEYTDIFEKPQVLEFRYRNLAAHLEISSQIVDGKTVVAQKITGWDLEPEEDGNSST